MMRIIRLFVLISQVSVFIKGCDGDPLLLFANMKDVSIIDAGGGQSRDAAVIVNGLKDATAVDYIYDDDLIFWADVSKRTIQSTSLQDVEMFADSLCKECKARVQTIIDTDIESPDGLAADWMSKKLYWTDSEHDRIEVSELDGRHRKVLVWEGLDQPRAITLDPIHGYMYWSDWGEVPKIERIAMNGEPHTRRVIVQQNIVWPTGLTIDYEQQRIYWADAKLEFIHSSALDGTDRRPVISDNLNNLYAVTLYGPSLYWTDWTQTAIMSCNKETGEERRNIVDGVMQQPMDVRVFDRSRQPAGLDVCSGDNGGCSHLCLLSPTLPFYSCACPTGVLLKNDNKTCQAVAARFILLARRPDIRFISLDTPDLTDMILPLHDVMHTVALTYDPVDSYVYWTDRDIKVIRRAKLDGSEQETILSEEVQEADGIAVDWIARNIYWTDTGSDRIEVARLNGSARKVLISDGLDEPRAIVLDPVAGYMYWSDWGDAAKIERAALDGSGREVLVNASLGWPNGLAIDYARHKLYWGDAEGDKIECVNLDGTGRTVILTGKDDALPHLFGLSLLGDYLYWTDWQERSIERINKRTGADRTYVAEEKSDIMDLTTVDMVDGYQGTNPCADDNYGCTDLCLHRPAQLGGTRCACQMSKELQADGKTCLVPDGFLLFSEKKNIHWSSLEITNNNQVIPLNGVQNALVLDFDVNENRVYWADTGLLSISRAFMNGSSLQPVVQFGLNHPEAMAVDWIARNLYWADLGTHRIEMARLDGTCRKVLLWEDVNHPRSIALDPANGYMYWMDWEPTPRIERAALDGSKRSQLVDTRGRSNGLTIDFNERRIYWVDIDNKTISSADMDGQDVRQVVASSLPNPFSMTQFEDFIYWTDWDLRSIERANKSNGLNRSTVQASLTAYVTDLLVFHQSRQSGWNGCARDNGNCSHLCIAHEAGTGYTHHCTCPTHYIMHESGNNCTAPQRFVLVSEKDRIHRMLFDDTQSPDIILPITNIKNIKAMTFDPLTDFVYWIEMKGTIRRAKAADGSGFSAVLGKSDGGSSERVEYGDPPSSERVDLALDPYARMLYMSDAETNSIAVVNITAASATRIGTVVSGRQQQPRHIAVDPIQGLLFWTNHADSAKIEKADLDGGIRHVSIVTTAVVNPVALTLDPVQQKVYWADAFFRRIESVNYDGSFRTILLENIDAPNGLVVIGEYIYWTDPTLKMIRRADKLTGANSMTVYSRLDHLSDIISAHVLTETERLKHPCALRNGNCTHLCVAVNASSAAALSNGCSRRCSCPEGLMLSSDRQSCVEPVSCGPEQFACRNGGDCFPLGWQCDGDSDCDDGSDEDGCRQCNVTTQFRCGNGKCLSLAARCDGTADCQGGSDETHCAPCVQHMFECRVTRTCVPRSLQCNKHRDCPHGEDETGCDAAGRVPSESRGTGSRTSYVAAIILCVLLVLALCVAVGYCWCKPKRQPPLHGTDIVMVTKPLTQYDAQNTVSHKSGTTLLTQTSDDMSACPSYDRNCLTGQSSEASSVTQYPHETLNPPPSPVTSHVTGDVFSFTSQSPSTIRSASYRPHQPKHLRRHYHHYHHHHHKRAIPSLHTTPCSRAVPPLHTTPCSTDVCDDSEPYPHGPPQPKYYQLSDSNYDSDVTGAPPPTPARSYCFDELSCPPSPSTERSFFINKGNAPPPSPVAFSDC